MRKILTFLPILLLSVFVLAQSPDAINYQAIARDTAGNVLANREINFRLSIQRWQMGGPSVYTETHLKTTNQFGLVTLEIGRGEVLSGSFYDIDWGSSNYFLETEMNFPGDNDYQLMGISQFLSVPYALYAKTAGNSIPVGTPGQTLRSDGSSWTPNSTIYNDGSVVGVGTEEPDPSAVLDVQSTTRGMLVPRMTMDERNTISNPATGLLIFCTDNNLFYSNKGTPASPDWIMINSQWFNNGLNIYYNDGDVGIGTTTPEQKLTVAGMIQTTSGGIKYPDNTIQTTAAVLNNAHTIGEIFGGGKVFFVYDNGQHGLIAATEDQSSGIRWAVWGTGNGIRNDGIFIGRNNTDSIINKFMSYGLDNYAAKICAKYLGGGFGDWYLPSKYELNLLYQQKDIVGGLVSTIYWSSTESDGFYAWAQSFDPDNYGYQLTYDKQDNHYVRAIRAF